MKLLKCLCWRKTTIDCAPLFYRSGYRDPNPVLRKFYQRRDLNIKNVPAFFRSIDETKVWLHTIFPILHPYHFRDRLDDIKLNTSPGLYYSKLGCKTKAEAIDKYHQEMRNQTHLVKTGKIQMRKHYISNVVVASAKENILTLEPKARVVWVYPLDVVAMENMFFSALKDCIPEDWVPSPANAHNIWCGRHSGSIDFKNFDSTISHTLIKIAFSLLRSLFDFSEYQGRGKPRRTSSVERLWDQIVDYFIHTPHVVNGDMRTKRWKHEGVPSGSMFTNLIDTIVSRIVATYLHRCNNCIANVRTYGDDVHFANCTCSSRGFETRAKEEFKMDVKPEKPNRHGCLTYCKTECHLGEPFHSGQWFRDIINTTSFTYETVQSLMHMEPTRSQYHELARVKAGSRPGRPSPWFARWKERISEYWPKFKRKWSDLEY